MSVKNICIVGGTGFVGRHLARRLDKLGYKITIPSRHRERHKSLLVLPCVSVINGDVYDQAFLQSIFANCHVVINLVGILNESAHDGKGFEHTHVELTKRIIDACNNSGVKRYLHMSGLNANPEGPSHYLRTKGIAENFVHESTNELAVTSFRPSVIFGEDDSFTNRFADLLKQVPLMFPLACPEAKLQPVYIEDVVTAFVHSITDPATINQRYDLCGPKVYSLQEIVEYLMRLMDIHRKIIRLSDKIARLQARTMEYAPGKPFTMDNYHSLQIDSVCNCPFPPVFGIQPKTMEEVVPEYLSAGKGRRVLDSFRRHASR
ncbi:MAG: complex I NDUFA9 subunit family protein [Gammaproteobacteria bacterium]|nr:complex I NDUFA9 subunit family protein [Gammaproteobacteria bacterium]